MKRILTLVVPLVLAMVFVTGCGGISKESYDAAMKESSDVKAQLSNVQTELATAQQNLTTVTADRDSTKSQFDKAKADLVTAQANLSKSTADLATVQQSFSTLSTSVKTYQPYADASILWFESHASFSQSDWNTWQADLDTAIANSHDSELQALRNTMQTATGTEHVAAENAIGPLLLKRLTELKPKTN